MSPFYPSRTQLRNRERRAPSLAAPGAPSGWTPGRVWSTTGSDLRKELATANEEVTLYIHARELEHPRYSRERGSRGRSTVLNSCVERLGEIHDDVNPNTEEGGHGLAD